MEKRISVTGSTQEEFKDVLKLCYKMFGENIASYKLYPNTTRKFFGDKDGKEYAENNPCPELHFYSYCIPSDACAFPCIMPSDAIALFSWAWLETKDIDKRVSTDGSLGRGWHVEAGDLFEYMDHPALIIKPETLIYGK